MSKTTDKIQAVMSKPTGKVDQVMFFPNGNTAVFRDGHQVAELQRPWLLVFIDTLIGEGIDPATVRFTLPDGRTARLFKLDDGSYNWNVA